MKLTSQDINDLMGVVGNRIDDLSDAGLAYTDNGDTDETKRLYSLYSKLKALSEESEEASERFIEAHKEALKRLAGEEEIENDWDVTPYGEQK